MVFKGISGVHAGRYIAAGFVGTLQDACTETGCLQLLPGVHKSDGFFIARLRKQEDRP